MNKDIIKQCLREVLEEYGLNIIIEARTAVPVKVNTKVIQAIQKEASKVTNCKKAEVIK